MQQNIVYTNTPLYNNKSGRAKPNKDGSYTVILGGLNTANNAGEWYTLEHSDKLFSSSSIFMTDVNEGTVESENGHPIRQPFHTKETWPQRFMSIQPDRVTNTIQKVWLDSTYARQINDPRMPKDAVIIMGEVVPFGEKQHILDAILRNPKKNLCYSIRCISDLYQGKVKRIRVIRSVITFDLVQTGGIVFSKKDFHPTIESIAHMPSKEVLDSLANLGQEERLQFTTENSAVNRIITDLDRDIITPPERRFYGI